MRKTKNPPSDETLPPSPAVTINVYFVTEGSVVSWVEIGGEGVESYSEEQPKLNRNIIKI